MSARELLPEAQLEDHGLLRFLTCGSVDDGKSTLIGRLLLDSKGLLADQITGLEAASRRRGLPEIDLSLLTDGLLAEREQGITIDVAYRYFATPARKFIIGDSPGHAQYTRNMVTAASTADVAVLLVDARHGLQPQTRRHAYLARWVGIPRVVLAVNKIDLVDDARGAFERIRTQFHQFATGLGFAEVREIPLSALRGDMVVERGDVLRWYRGPTLLQYLESAPARHDEQAQPLRFPVQRVVRVAGGNAQPGSGYEIGEFRGYQGTIASGRVHLGDAVVALPAGTRAHVTEILTPDGPLQQAGADMAVTLRLDTQIDLSRGDLLAAEDALPYHGQDIAAEVCWFDGEPLVPERPYLIKHGCATVRARFAALDHRIDVDSLRLVERPQTLHMNDIARVQLRAQHPLAVDPYTSNRTTGAFIIIDEATNRTVAAGTVR
ncbi:MAG: sulfate adenylyltransferase [Burkholderiales bacterium]|nr:sulfate adenylyltransferase [Burkholderiales bacterium]